MKVGIITYHHSYNYGAQLQAFALCTYLRQQGFDVEVIDCNLIGRGSLFHWSFRSPRAFFGALRNNVLSLVSDLKRRKRFDHFCRVEIPQSSQCLTKDKLDGIAKGYDYVITGSDQVWHPQICEGQKCFFLDLPIDKDRKVAYAPSFGVSDYSGAEAAEYMPLISDIGHLSVREETGKNIIKKHLGLDVEIVVDPTMLLGKQYWESITIKPKLSKYLLYFTILDEPEGTDGLVRKIAERRGLKIVRIGALKDILKPHFINGRAAGPKEFLGLVKYADFIVTSSFHGTVFSILYEKQFITIFNNNERNSRLETLTARLYLDSQLVKNVSSYDIRNYHHIDYKSVLPNLDELRSHSTRFLNEALSPL